MRAKAMAVLTMVRPASRSAPRRRRKPEKRGRRIPSYQYNVGLFYLNQSDVENATKYFVKALSLDTRFYLGLQRHGAGPFHERPP